MGIEFDDKDSPGMNQNGYDELVRTEDEKMGLGKCGKFLKYSMFLFNAVILIAGCGLLGFGVYTRTSENRLTQLSSILGSYYYSALSLALIISGGVVIVLAFLGCCGAIKEVKCMLGTFFILLFMMLVGTIVGGILAYVYRDSIGEVILEDLYTSLNTSYGVPGQQDVTDAWDIMQTFFDCCGVVGGVNSTTSWAYYKGYSVWFRNQTGVREYVPDSCCKNAFGLNRTKCVGGVGFEHMIPAVDPPTGVDQENDNLYTEGCYTAVLVFLIDNAKVLGGVGAGIGVLMLLGMTFALCLCRRIKDDFMFD